jgi:hypothetical protein
VASDASVLAALAALPPGCGAAALAALWQRIQSTGDVLTVVLGALDSCETLGRRLPHLARRGSARLRVAARVPSGAIIASAQGRAVVRARVARAPRPAAEGALQQQGSLQ